jgi:xylulokinase
MLAQGLNIEHHVVPGLYVSFLFNQAGVLVKWYRNTFAATESFDQLLAEMPEEPTRLLCLPYFEMTGSPDFKPDAAGAILGLHTSTPRGVILKGILEGVTFHFVESLAGLRGLGVSLSEFVASGGGAKSDAWLQLTADVLGIPVVRPRVTEAGLLGAAMLAGGLGVRENWMRRERVFEPHYGRHQQYRERHARYREFLKAALPLMRHC